MTRRTVLALPLAATRLAGTARADPPLDALMRRLAAVPASRASFTERKTVAALTEPVIDTGRLAYRRPDYLEKVTLPPDRETLVVKGDHLTLTVGDEAPRTLDLAEAPPISALVDTVRGTLAGDLPALERAYAVTMTGSLDDWRLTLVPRAAGVAQFLRQVVIAGAGASLRSVTVAQANGDGSVMTIVPDP